MPPKIFYSDAEKRAAMGQGAKPKAVKAGNANKTGGKIPAKKVALKKTPQSSGAKKNVNNNKNNSNSNNNKSVTVTPSGVRLTKSNAVTGSKKINVNVNSKAAKNAKLVKANTTSTAGKQQQQQQPKKKSKLESAVETARAVSRNKNHFNHTEVRGLLESYEKGWTPKEKFLELLPKLLGLQ